VEKPDEYDAYYARRLLSFDTVQKNRLQRTALTNIAGGRQAGIRAQAGCRIEYRLLSIEDNLFGRVYLTSRNLKRYEETLPDTYDAEALDKLAWSEGKQNTDNNDLLIRNSFYNSRLRTHIKRLKGSQINYDYTKSPEFGDFELVLHEMQKLRMDVLFIIPPINGRWTEYTGLPREMLKVWSNKIEAQLRRQGFDRIINLQQKSDTAYFMQDTIHIGWRSWVATDKIIAPFLANPDVPKPPAYQTNTYYLSEEWADFSP
jgi:D-alanine transfer protein